MEYMQTADGSEGGCFLCESLAANEDEKTGILFRGEQVFVILNAFPYNTGHLLIAPDRHEGELEGLTSGERAELMEVTTKSVSVIKEAMKPEGFNVGMNLGAVAGAGVPGHLHVHVVPRWAGDTNFMPVVGETKVLPELLADTAAKLRPGFAS
jgi:ATP adenylyltransferase